jgi:hypothetical protein
VGRSVGLLLLVLAAPCCPTLGRAAAGTPSIEVRATSLRVR